MGQGSYRGEMDNEALIVYLLEEKAMGRHRDACLGSDA